MFDVPLDALRVTSGTIF